MLGWKIITLLLVWRRGGVMSVAIVPGVIQLELRDRHTGSRAHGGSARPFSNLKVMNSVN